MHIWETLGMRLCISEQGMRKSSGKVVLQLRSDPARQLEKPQAIAKIIILHNPLNCSLPSSSMLLLITP